MRLRWHKNRRPHKSSSWQPIAGASLGHRTRQAVSSMASDGRQPCRQKRSPSGPPCSHHEDMTRLFFFVAVVILRRAKWHKNHIVILINRPRGNPSRAPRWAIARGGRVRDHANSPPERSARAQGRSGARSVLAINYSIKTFNFFGCQTTHGARH